MYKWREKRWLYLIHYISIFHILVRGWIAFEFRKVEDVEVIVLEKWFWGASYLDMQIWHKRFNIWKKFL